MAKTRACVVIADDEQYVCTLLREIIRWDELNLELAGTARNGRELYEIILEKRPDIVITDICMPEMDGIELIRLVRQKGIGSHFIIVSGYRLFEYAHDALKYNVEDYILKPIDEDELNERLRDIASTLSAREEDRALQEGQESIRRFFLKRVADELDERETPLEEIRKEYGIAFRPGLFQAVCVSLDVTSPQEDHMDELAGLQKKITCCLSRFLGRHCAELLVDAEANRAMVGMNYASDEAEAVARALEEYYAYISDTVNLVTGVKVTLGVGGAFSSVGKLRLSKRQAESAILCRTVLGPGRVIFYGQVARPGLALPEARVETVMREIQRACESWNAAAFLKGTKELFEAIRLRFDPESAQALYERVVETFYDTCGALVAEYSNEDYLRKQIDYGMKAAISLPAMERAITDPIVSTMAALRNQVSRQRTKPIRQVIQYIEENYARPIRLEDAAALANLSPTYFSNLFRKETDTGFSDFLTDVRMRKAKEFLQKTDMTIGEIADRTGYADARYFSKLFSKTVGIKPTEYRKIYG